VKTILLIEDDPTLLRLAQQILRESGYAADWVSDGDQARKKLKATPYHGIVLDLGVPGGDGYALASQLGDANRHTPLVIVGSDAPDARKRAFEAGALAFLSKPFTGEALRSVINSVISPEGPRPPAAPRTTRPTAPIAVRPTGPVAMPAPVDDPFPVPERVSEPAEGAIAVRFQGGPLYWCEPDPEGGWRCGRCEVGIIPTAVVGHACSVCHAEVAGAEPARAALGVGWLFLFLFFALALAAGWFFLARE
jgi:CheY-like chemotaxis protein